MAFQGGKKKNAFFMYMEERRSEVEAAGILLPRGFADLAEVVGPDWMKLSTQEKAVYEERARKYNEKLRQPGPEVQKPGVRKPKNMKPGEHPLAYELRMEQEAERRRFQDECRTNRSIVTSFFDTDDWISTPIVICSFALFFEPNPAALLEEFIPAEIGLAAFSLKDGIIDNFARLIDPDDDIPKGRGLEAFSAAKEMGFPILGSCEELKEYETLAVTIESFLAKNAQKSEGKYFVFALSRDMEKVNGCLQWISEVSGRLIPVKVLNLSLWAHFASTRNNKRFRGQKENLGAAPSNSRVATTMMADTLQKLIDAGVLAVQASTNRIKGSSFTSTFKYPDEYPMSRFGIFVVEDDVDNILQKTTNYKYYDEICCMYHMKKRDGIEQCALNISNHHAFCLLEILTMSNRIDSIRRGFHFPTVDQLSEERERRISMLKRWGFTEVELAMRDENLEKHQFEMEQKQRKEQNNLQVNVRPSPGEGQSRSRHNAYEGRPTGREPRRGGNAGDAGEEPGERYAVTGDGRNNTRGNRPFKK